MEDGELSDMGAVQEISIELEGRLDEGYERGKVLECLPTWRAVGLGGKMTLTSRFKNLFAYYSAIRL